MAIIETRRFGGAQRHGPGLWSFRALLARVQQWRRDRAAAMPDRPRETDERLLRDIGLTRDQLLRGWGTPFWW
jgi:hypothetical protein